MSKEFYIVPTYRCNSSCTMCGVFNSKRHSNWEYSKEELLTQIKSYNLQPEDYLIFSGGEPLLYNELPDIIKFVKDTYKSKIVIFTNGRILKNNNYVKLLENLEVNKLLIPLFSNDSKTHDSITNISGSFNETVQGLKNLNNSKINFEIKNLITKINYSNLKEWALFCIDNFPNAQTLSLHGIHLQGDATKSRDELVIEFSKASEFISQASDVVLSSKIPLILAAFPMCTIDPVYWKYYLSPRLVDSEIIAPDKEKIKITNNNNYSVKPDKCQNCLLNKRCSWAWKMYCKYYGDQELNSIV
jgi:MoaA/NifB/PqqE/SkfB family radical SAM enzyme